MANTPESKIDKYTDLIIRMRWWVILLPVVGFMTLGTGARHMELEQNYRIFFGPDNPQVVALDAMEEKFSKFDWHTFVVHNPKGTIFTPDALTAIREITDAGWKIPHATRVDSLVNYQYSWSVDDDMIVEDLLPAGLERDASAIARAREVALSDPITAGNVVTRDEDTALITVRVLLNEEDGAAVRESAFGARALASQARENHPDLRFELTGTAMLTNAFGEAPLNAARSVFPAMFFLVGLFMVITIRSVSGIIGTIGVITLSTVGAMGASGFLGINMNPVTLAGPVVILTLAIADSVHIVLTMRGEMRQGSDKISALKKSIQINAEPIFLTSLTTAIGFLIMNFSDSPPFHALGNMTAIGVGFAWILSMTFLPAVLSVLPMRETEGSSKSESMLLSLANFVIAHQRKLAFVLTGSVIFFIASIFRMDINDVPHQYFAKSIDFRNASDFLDDQKGFYGFFMSVDSSGPGGINDPEYLDSLDRFATWFREQDTVQHVSVYTDIIKRLNKNLHGDDPAYYKIPENRELAAQFLLLYEMGLPYGLDLNSQINVDKSATLVSVSVQHSSLRECRELGERAEQWLLDNGPGTVPQPATGVAIMFSHIAGRNISSMVGGTLVAFVLIALIMIVSLRSVLLGVLSLVPNIVPAATAFGIWAIVVGHAGFAISVVAGLSIGIIVDDTVHFLSKYARARRVLGLDAEDAVRYAFATVGQALLSTSLIVAGGFAVLGLSTFRVTMLMGTLTSLTVVCALVADFLLLPALLLILDRRHITLKDPSPLMERA